MTANRAIYPIATMCRLLGADGGKINALLAAAGHNLRFVLRKLALCFVRFLGTRPGIMPPEARIWAPHSGRSAISDTWLGPAPPAASMA